MLGWNKGADEMIGTRFNRIQIIRRIVAFIEDEGDVLGFLGDLTAPGNQFGSETGESGGIGLIAWIGTMQERHMEIGGNEQCQANNAQTLALLLALAPLGKGASFIEGIDVGEEVGGIEEYLSQVDLELLDHVSGNVLFDGLDGLA